MTVLVLFFDFMKYLTNCKSRFDCGEIRRKEYPYIGSLLQEDPGARHQQQQANFVASVL